MSIKLFAAAAALAVSSAFAEPQAWNLDKVHSSITFKVSHMVVGKTVGKFDKYEMAINWDEKKIQNSSVNVTIDASSVNTGDPKRDEHLRGADFFDVAKYPTITFASTKITPKGKNQALVQGKLTMRGVTKDASFVFSGKGPIKNPYADARKGGAAASFVVNRKDYGIVYNSVLEAGGLAIGEEVNVDVEIEADQPIVASPEASPAATEKPAAGKGKAKSK